MTYMFANTEVDGHVLTVVLNRPEARNALHADANHELGEIFDAFEADPALRVAILTGAGDRAFCAGADLKAAVDGFDTSRPPVPPSGFAGLTHRFDRAKPVIAAVNGTAAGGGFELALACDLIIAADTAKFGLTEPKVGLAALGGGIQRLIREIGSKRANALLLTGRIVPAEAGLALGFVNQVVPAGELMQAARAWADEILICSPASIRATRSVARALDGRSVEASIRTMMELPDVVALLDSPDAREGPLAFSQRRAPRWATIPC